MKVYLAALVVALAVVSVAAGAPGAKVDPRTGGFEVGMGEWSVSLEAPAIRPGQVTFVFTNNGKYGHGLRIRSIDRDDRDDDDGARGARKDRFEVRTAVAKPGETIRLTVDLAEGRYDVECFVEDVHGDHEERGMHALLDVRADAPFVDPPAKQAAKNVVVIKGFKFQPAPFRTKVGSTVKWINEDAAKHTVSDLKGAFTSKVLTKGQTYARKFTRATTYTYLCAVHPAMKAKLIVER